MQTSIPYPNPNPNLTLTSRVSISESFSFLKLKLELLTRFSMVYHLDQKLDHSLTDLLTTQ
uniref:Uncharacterized protein n=1 Tax=Rhizophagus irregularis (strain DAOM 181602 / DAOM 197198 / MUCL 43194) TaxID=747089 RepID=U9TUD6_RHIID